jgi:hypothetical protein
MADSFCSPTCRLTYLHLGPLLHALQLSAPLGMRGCSCIELIWHTSSLLKQLLLRATDDASDVQIWQLLNLSALCLLLSLLCNTPSSRKKGFLGHRKSLSPSNDTFGAMVVLWQMSVEQSSLHRIGLVQNSETIRSCYLSDEYSFSRRGSVYTSSDTLASGGDASLTHFQRAHNL